MRTTDRLIHTTQNLRRWDYGPRPATLQQVVNAGYITDNQPITITGDVTGSGTTSITLELTNTGVLPGAYTNTSITVDEDGRIIAAANGSGGVGGGGTVTNIAVGTGLVAVPSPITTTGTVSLSVPVSIANGGTGSATAGGALANLSPAVVVLTPASGATVALAVIGPHYIDNAATLASLTLRLPAVGNGLLEIGFRNPVTALTIQTAAGAAVAGAPTNAYGPGAALQFRVVGAAWVYWK